MNRRDSVLAILAFGALPHVARAQQAAKVHRIGILETRSAELNAANFDAFRKGLQELGYKEGHNLEMVYLSSDGRGERFPDLASQLVRLKVDLILTRGTPAALASKRATRAIPVVMAGSGDPVASGLAASLGHPGGNVTGLSYLNVEIYAKRTELLREIVPKLKRIAGLFNMSNPILPVQWKEVERAARSFGIQSQLLDVRHAEDFPRAFNEATKQHAGALIVALDSVTQANLRLIAELAVNHRLPSIYDAAEYVEFGGLVSYGANEPDNYRRAATYVDKIFKGALPGDLPIEQPTRFELAINLKAAQAMGMKIPQSVLIRADRVIE